jgi:hypothetical protein
MSQRELITNRRRVNNRITDHASIVAVVEVCRWRRLNALTRECSCDVLEMGEDGGEAIDRESASRSMRLAGTVCVCVRIQHLDEVRVSSTAG